MLDILQMIAQIVTDYGSQVVSYIVEKLKALLAEYVQSRIQRLNFNCYNCSVDITINIQINQCTDKLSESNKDNAKNSSKSKEENF